MLNLARKWRSKQFHEIVGQELSVRMLQNSLYKGHIFPVYLFSGQRGCGKTTTARIFAAALNCKALELFRSDPKKQALPCLQCVSCDAMASGSHPDFIEIDAASYTGVDNVRTIIEAASLLPVLGSKRIYLIDEAHMLSKAAFNAFLKLLEEPPPSVVFMLATTDPDKILETVRSRCFQLFFSAIDTDALVCHLQHVCKEEQIDVEDQALRVIVRETEGSARDALNLLEQVRFSSEKVTHDAVLKVLGHMPEALLLELVEALSTHDIALSMALLQKCYDQNYAPLLIWQKLQEVFRFLLVASYGVQQTIEYHDKQKIEYLVKSLSTQTLVRWLHVLYNYEMILLKSTAQHGVLHMIIMTILTESGVALGGIQQPVVHVKKEAPVALSISQKEDHKEQQEVRNVRVVKNDEVTSVESEQWNQFLQSIEQLSDPLLKSIFKQGVFSSYDQMTGKVTVMFPIAAKFYGEWLQETTVVWLPLLQQYFGQQAHCQPLFEEKVVVHEQKSDNSQEVDQQKKVQAASVTLSTTVKQGRVPNHKGEKKIDVSDTTVWEKTHQLLERYGGTVVEVEELK